ncbi:MAG: hypothetical protein ACNFW9_06115 [Candidatus Kerfeldbacteria bacterium]
MAKDYLAKIKATTAKGMAQSIISSKTGKKISDTKFKTLMKKDKNLKKFAYLGKTSTIAKHQAKKFFNSVVESSQGSDQFKINKIAAKKLGLRINKQGKASTIGINKLYESATKDELSQAKDTGPTPQEIRKQKRHEKSIKKLHQQDRARENAENDKEEGKKPSKKDEKSTSNTAPMRQTGSSGASFSQKTSTAPSLSDSVSHTSPKINNTPELPKLFIPPLNNLSLHIDNIKPIAKKIEISLKQIFHYLKSFNIITDEVSSKAALDIGFNNIPNPANKDILKKISIETGAQLFIYGIIQKQGPLLKIKIDIINAETDQAIHLAVLEQKSLDYFELEKKLTWEINNSLQNEKSSNINNQISENKAIDLPI